MELLSVQIEIDLCCHSMSEFWINVDPATGYRSLKPEYHKRHQVLQSRILFLRDRRVELERELQQEPAEHIQ